MDAKLTSPNQAKHGHGFFLLIDVEARTSKSNFILTSWGKKSYFLCWTLLAFTQNKKDL
jgi:hypothetical protein